MTKSGQNIRIAICGGPYANPYALSAFVEDSRKRGCEKLFCLGDLGGFGADIDALWPIIMKESITCIAGNYDVAISRGDADCGCGYSDPRDNEYAQLIYDHTRNHTNKKFADWMGTLPIELRDDFKGHSVHFVHGSPLALNDFWWESLSESEHLERVDASGAEVICCTHSGLPWTKRVGPSLVVNVGVIGKPANDGQTGVWYAILEFSQNDVEVELVSLDYDWRSQADSMRRSGIPEAFVETIETGWWTTCLEVLPPKERSKGLYQLYRSSLPKDFAPIEGSWGEIDTEDKHELHLPVVPLFGTSYFPRRLWIYTNFHCNLSCDYCAVGSSPAAERRIIAPERFRALIDEAVAEGFTQIYLTGGEPMLHPQIDELLEYSSDYLDTVLLSNATLFRGSRLERFCNLTNKNRIVLQTSLDGAKSNTHDLHRGQGSFANAMKGVQNVLDLGFEVRVAMTETPENSQEIDTLAQMLIDFGVKPDNFMVRPLLKRGYSLEGLNIALENTIPELTLTQDGAYWHPAGADCETSPDMLLAKGEISIAIAKQLIAERFFTARLKDGSLPRVYRCAV